MDRDILLALVGGGIGVAGATVGALVSYLLQRRAQLSQWDHDKAMRREQWHREDIDSLRAGRDIRTVLRDPRGEFACFPRGTLLTLRDGSRKAIESVEVGDELLSYDVDSSCFSATKVASLFNGQASEHYCLNGAVTMTSSHFALANGRFSRARDLRLGDSLLDESGEHRPLLSLALECGKREVLNINTVGDKGFFANGILVGTFASKVSPEGTTVSDEEIVEIDADGKVWSRNA